MQPDTSLVKEPAIELVSGDGAAWLGLVAILVLLFIFWYAATKGEKP